MSTNSISLNIAAIVPPALVGFFKPFPVLTSEDPNEYKLLLNVLVEQIKPEDVNEWILLKDIVDSYWEMKRYSNMKAGLIDVTRKSAARCALESIAEGNDQERAAFVAEHCKVWSEGEEGRSKVEVTLCVHGIGTRELDAQAGALRASEMELFDRQLERARVNATRRLHEIECYRGGASWKRPKVVHEIREQPIKSLAAPDGQDTGVQ